MANEPLRTFLKLKQLTVATGMSRSWIYHSIKEGRFPAPVALGARAVRWDRTAIVEWQESRLEQTRKSSKSREVK